MSYREREIRLVMLRITAEGDGTANDRLLWRGLDHWGLSVSLDVVRDQIEWLRDQGLVQREIDLERNIHVVGGVDVAQQLRERLRQPSNEARF